MPNAQWDDLELPSDPTLLTRELALQVFEHPTVLMRALARLAPSAGASQPPRDTQHMPNGAGLLENGVPHAS